MKDLKSIDRLLLNYATLVDNIDMYTAPFFRAAQISGSETMKELSVYTRILEYAILKIPFITLYTMRTLDFRALLDWAPKEMIALTVPFGELIQLFRRYEKRTKKYYEMKS